MESTIVEVKNEQRMMKKSDRICAALVFAGVFAFIMLWCTVLHPIQIFDVDDWTFIQSHREAVPIWRAWNPIRVLPEVFMPLFSMLGGYVFYPFSGDFFGAFTLAYALAVSIAVTLLFYTVWKAVSSRGISGKTALLLLCYFLICHFWIMRYRTSGNEYMLHALNATCVFFYLIPDLLCSVWVIWTHHSGILREIRKTRVSKKAAWLFLTYFCLFSNLWSNLIVGAYLGAVLLLALAGELRMHSFKIRTFIIEHLPELILLLVWGVSQLFEKSGGRAAQIGNESIRSQIYVSLYVYYKNLRHLNRWFVISSLVILAVGTAMILVNRNKKDWKELTGCGVAFLLASAYLVLSCAMAGPGYLYRPDVFYSLFFYYMLAVLICLIQILRRLPGFKTVLPLLLFMAAVNCTTSGKTFLEYNSFFEPAVCRNISEDILGQLQRADEDGLSEITLYVPKFETGDNWPIAEYASSPLSSGPYVYHATGRKINIIEIVPTQEKNAELIPEGS